MVLYNIFFLLSLFTLKDISLQKNNVMRNSINTIFNPSDVELNYTINQQIVVEAILEANSINELSIFKSI